MEHNGVDYALPSSSDCVLPNSVYVDLKAKACGKRVTRSRGLCVQGERGVSPSMLQKISMDSLGIVNC